MLSVFIGYGGAKAEEVADSLNSFFKSWLLESFCGSPRSNQIPQGMTPDQIKQFIRKKIEESSIIVLVCHSESLTSQPFIEEINYIWEHGLNLKVIVFSKCDHCIPEPAAQSWHPSHFASERESESFPRLLNEVFSKYIGLSSTAELEQSARGA
jgi:hypothetical protein